MTEQTLINKKQLIRNVHNRIRIEVPMTKTEQMIESVFSAIEDHLMRGHTVSISGFGRLILTSRNARKGRNPQTGETIQIPFQKVVKFKPANRLKERLKREFEGIHRSYLPLGSIIRIDEVEKRGVSKISDIPKNGNVISPFPASGLIPPKRDNENSSDS